MKHYNKGLLFISEQEICFATQQRPEIYNIGDDLCSPRHYYDFSTEKLASVLVAGGGVFSDFGYRCVKIKPADIKIIWGFGLSQSLSSADKQAGFIKYAFRTIKRKYGKYIAKKTYHFSSSRDPFVVDLGYVFVPCPSCFHPITEVSVGSNIGVVVNANPKTHGGAVETTLKNLRTMFPDVIFATNDLSEEEALSFLGKVDRVVTNSYHFAYWSLLGGRRVQLISYSTKFTGLLQIFGLTPEVSQWYKKQDSLSLQTCIETSLTTPNWIYAPNHNALLEKFRVLNNNFAGTIHNSPLPINVNLKRKYVR